MTRYAVFLALSAEDLCKDAFKDYEFRELRPLH